MREKCPYSEFFWSVFFCIWTEYGEILRIYPNLVRMRENTNQENSEHGNFTQCLPSKKASFFSFSNSYFSEKSLETGPLILRDNKNIWLTVTLLTLLKVANINFTWEGKVLFCIYINPNLLFLSCWS